MAVTTFSEFVDNLEDLDVVGVVRKFEEGPPMSEAADRPFQYVRYPQGDESAIVFGEGGGLATMQAELVICVEAIGQNTQAANFDDTVDMMDALITALRAKGRCWPGQGGTTWNIRMGVDTVAGQDYWAVIALVKGSGGL